MHERAPAFFQMQNKQIRQWFRPAIVKGDRKVARQRDLQGCREVSHSAIKEKFFRLIRRGTGGKRIRECEHGIRFPRGKIMGGRDIERIRRQGGAIRCLREMKVVPRNPAFFHAAPGRLWSDPAASKRGHHIRGHYRLHGGPNRRRLGIPFGDASIGKSDANIHVAIGICVKIDHRGLHSLQAPHRPLGENGAVKNSWPGILPTVNELREGRRLQRPPLQQLSVRSLNGSERSPFMRDQGSIGRLFRGEHGEQREIGGRANHQNGFYHREIDFHKVHAATRAIITCHAIGKEL